MENKFKSRNQERVWLANKAVKRDIFCTLSVPIRENADQNNSELSASHLF